MKFPCRQFNITTGVIKKKNEVYKVEIHCPNLSPFHSIFMVRRSGIICGPIWGSFPVRGSFAVQFGDHFRSGDHLRACAGQNLAMSYRNKLLSYNKKLSTPYITRTFNATIQLYRVTSPLKAFCPSENKIFAMVRNEKVQFSAQFSRPKAFWRDIPPKWIVIFPWSIQ